MILKRDGIRFLEIWHTTKPRSPLVIFGPRQVGKTTLAREFAARHYANRIIEINFYRDLRELKERKRFAEIFESSQEPQKILDNLSILIQRKIDVDKDILILDEIQDCKPAYEVLKNFKDDFPEFPIIASGSYLGLFLETESLLRHPVGATQEYQLSPLSFSEFLSNFNLPLYEAYQAISLTHKSVDVFVHNELLNALNIYLFTGGMPEAVTSYLNNYAVDLQLATTQTRGKQQGLLTQFYRDMDKYAQNTDVKKLRKIFETIPFYLERYIEDNVDRLQFKEIAERSTYSQLKRSFDYLKFNGLSIESQIINNPKFPLAIHQHENEKNRFKLFLFDVGLLNAALDIPYLQLFNKDMSHYKGYLLENFVAQQIKKHTKSTTLFSYKKNSREQAAEIEFLILNNASIVPLEVKSARKSTRSKSLASYITQFNPAQAFKCTLNSIRQEDRVTSIPIYLVEKVVSSES